MAKILLVEDEKMIRDMIARYLQMTGHEVLTAIDGVQAITTVLTEQPDLILMDMRLPVLDGWQAVVQLRAAPEACSIPIIALTAYATAEDRTRCLEVGCNDYEAKPVNFSRLQGKIQTLLDRSRATDGT